MSHSGYQELSSHEVFSNLHSGDYIRNNFSNLLRCSTISFLLDLIRNVPRTDDDGALSKDALWITQKRRFIDYSDDCRQTEKWQIEIDWGILQNIAEQFGIRFEEGLPVLLPMFVFRRFVATEYECSSDNNVFMTHRKMNNEFAALMEIASLCLPYDHDLIDYIHNRLNSFQQYGGNHDTETTRKLLKEQYQQYDRALEDIAQKIEEYNIIIDSRNQDIFLRLCDAYTEQYPVCAAIPAHLQGRVTYTFSIIRFGELRIDQYLQQNKDRHADALNKLRNPILQQFDNTQCFPIKRLRAIRKFDNQHRNEKKSIDSFYNEKRTLAKLGFVEFNIERQWLRNSTFLSITFARECRAALIKDVGFEDGATGLGPTQQGQHTRRSEDRLFSALRKDSPEYTESLQGWIIPRRRMVRPVMAYFWIELLVLSLFVIHMVSGLVQISIAPDLPASMFRTLAIAQLGLSAFYAGKDESRMITRIMQKPRRRVQWAAFLTGLLLILSLTVTPPKTGIPTIPWSAPFWGLMITAIVLLSGIISLFAIGAWLLSYSKVRRSDDEAIR